MKINGKSIDKFIEIITQEQTVSFWGDKYTFTPVMCPNMIGDGQQIIYFGTTDQRPFWWYVRIDSKTDIESEDFDIEEVVNLLEGVYGRCDYLLSKKEFEEIKRKGEDFCYKKYCQVDLYENVMSSKNYKYWFNNFVEYPRVHYSGGHWGFVANFKTGEISDDYYYKIKNETP